MYVSYTELSVLTEPQHRNESYFLWQSDNTSGNVTTVLYSLSFWNWQRRPFWSFIQFRSDYGTLFSNDNMICSGISRKPWNSSPTPIKYSPALSINQPNLQAKSLHAARVRNWNIPILLFPPVSARRIPFRISNCALIRRNH